MIQDDFNRPDETPLGRRGPGTQDVDWGGFEPTFPQASRPKLSTGLVESLGDATMDNAVYIAREFGPDQAAQVTVQTNEQGTWGVYLRVTARDSSYFAQVDNSLGRARLTLYSRGAGMYSALSGGRVDLGPSPGPGAGSTLVFSASGNTLKASVGGKTVEVVDTSLNGPGQPGLEVGDFGDPNHRQSVSNFKAVGELPFPRSGDVSYVGSSPLRIVRRNFSPCTEGASINSGALRFWHFHGGEFTQHAVASGSSVLSFTAVSTYILAVAQSIQTSGGDVLALLTATLAVGSAAAPAAVANVRLSRDGVVLRENCGYTVQLSANDPLVAQTDVTLVWLDLGLATAVHTYAAFVYPVNDPQSRGVVNMLNRRLTLTELRR